MKRGTLTHSSGGRRLLAKKRNGSYWLHVEDGFSVVDMPIPDDLAERLADFLTDDPAQPSGGSGGLAANNGPSTGAGNPGSGKPVSGSSPASSASSDTVTPAPKEDCSTCRGTGETLGLFAGMRVPCPDCRRAA